MRDRAAQGPRWRDARAPAQGVRGGNTDRRVVELSDVRVESCSFPLRSDFTARGLAGHELGQSSGWSPDGRYACSKSQVILLVRLLSRLSVRQSLRLAQAESRH